MTSFYNLSKADPAIADSGGVQFVGQRGHLLGQGSLSQLAAVIGPRHPRKRKLLRSLPFRHNKKQRLATQALFRQQMSINFMYSFIYRHNLHLFFSIWLSECFSRVA